MLDEEMADAGTADRPLTNKERQRLRQLEAADQQPKRAREQAAASKGGKPGGKGQYTFNRRGPRQNRGRGGAKGKGGRR